MPIEYTQRHGGCAILCGAAPCLLDDLQKARELRPNADILGVKFAACVVPEIKHVWSLHADMAGKIKEKAGHEVFVHCRPRRHQTKTSMWFSPVKDEHWAQVDYVWPDLWWASGSSGIAGALWAKHGMGYDEVILAGIPLKVGDRGYVAGYGQTGRHNGDYARDDQIDTWYRAMKKHHAEGKMAGIYSMSGSTRTILGAPC